MPIKLLLVICSVCMLATSAYLLFFNASREYVSAETSTNASFEAFWEAYIETHTPEEAYALFKESYPNTEASDQHLIAHLFGGALYDAEGLDGLTVCDMFFASGCFHEFLGRALLEHGEGILPEIDRYCKESIYDCQHGIGHGLLGYSGYEYQNLLQALELCNEIGTTDVRDGCFGGIFMEYNLRTMLENTPMRTLASGEAPDALCTTVPEYATQACYFWLAQWLMASEVGSTQEKFTNAAQTCSQTDVPENRLTCYSGLANELPSYTEDRRLMSSLCDNQMLQTADSLFKVQCKAGTASALYMDNDTRMIAPELCTSLEGKEHEFCLFFSTEADGKRIAPFTSWDSNMAESRRMQL